ncbi:CPBP family intramembrane metalloprotease [Mycolicibacterium cosmeticum]|uniref:Caax amino protease n=1 Tax=Mycolicibacterium cosmeticum TaxID=258533 RepID=W9AVX3_MYCCO|nr:CPBP family intramembrane glutamic endopeptidase [Mycolicibacterium cosmeticum]TLH66508.1 CPBP family intramembrane metalloprotease [Mycolicibacterium cosmeticum]CDO06741.1 caax amino protease [Mycolicibacterium cosmeticum]
MIPPPWRTVAPAAEETPHVVRRRRITVIGVLVIGAALQAYSLSRHPGDSSFYVLTLVMAAVWTVGAVSSGPLHMGRLPGSGRRPVLLGIGVGLGLGAVFVVGGLIARLIPPVRDYVTAVLEFANHGPLLLVVFITVVNGVAEELFFRGALYSALGGRRPVLVSTAIYFVAVMAAGNPMLGFAAILLGAACALQRRMTGGVLAPMLTHFCWGLVMVLALPPIFGV